MLRNAENLAYNRETDFYIGMVVERVDTPHTDGPGPFNRRVSSVAVRIRMAVMVETGFAGSSPAHVNAGKDRRRYQSAWGLNDV